MDASMMTAADIERLNNLLIDAHFGSGPWARHTPKVRNAYITEMRSVTDDLMRRELPNLTDTELHKLIAKMTVRDPFCAGWGWSDTNPDGTARVGCLIGSIYASADFFTDPLAAGPGVVRPDKKRIFTLAAYVFPAWVAAGRFQKPIGDLVPHVDRLSAAGLDDLAHLLEEEYNRRYPVTLTPAEAVELEVATL